MAVYRIRALHVGTMYGDMSSLTRMRNFGRQVEIPSVMWLVDDGEETMVIDTGVPDPEWALQHHESLSRTSEQEPGFALTAAGVDRTTVRLVVLTHLHWDHASNNHLFPNAEFVVHSNELAYANDPLPVHRGGYEWSDHAPGAFIQHTTFTTVAADVRLRPGVDILHAPGHTPGSVVVAVTTRHGLAVIAGDTVPLFENWRGDDAYLSHIPNADSTDLTAYFRTFAKIEQLRPAIVLPSHDMKLIREPETWAPWSFEADT